RGASLRVPLWVIPGHPDGAATLHFGNGRKRSARYVEDLLGGRYQTEHEGTVGVNVYPIRFSDALAGGGGARIVRVNGPTYPIACTQEHQSINLRDTGGDRKIIHAGTFEEYQKDPRSIVEGEETNSESMYPGFAYKGHAWAMVIDPSVCTGCNGCVIACVS